MPKKRKSSARSKGHDRWVDRELERIIREYRAAMHLDVPHGGYLETDDLPKVKIAPPAVKPKSVKSDQIRKAVRTAVQEYSERRTKSLARS